MNPLPETHLEMLQRALIKTGRLDLAKDWARRQFAPLQEMYARYRCALMEVETKFRVLDEEFSIDGEHNPVESIKTRVKSPESVIDKLVRKDLPISVEAIEENIKDVAGIRVICSFQSDIYMLAEALLRQDDVELVRKKDYIANPKPNGYRSLHLIIATPIHLHDRSKMMNVEVQLRTLAMDVWASVEHKIYYKKNTEDLPGSVREELLTCARLSSELDARMQYLKELAFGNGSESGPVALPEA